jgi:hypothetical protein
MVANDGGGQKGEGRTSAGGGEEPRRIRRTSRGTRRWAGNGGEQMEQIGMEQIGRVTSAGGRRRRAEGARGADRHRRASGRAEGSL